MLEQEKILKIKFLSFDQTSHGGCRHFQSLVVVVRALTNRHNPNSSFLSWHHDIMTLWHYYSTWYIMTTLSSVSRARGSWVCGGQQYSRCYKGKLWSGTLSEISVTENCNNNKTQRYTGEVVWLWSWRVSVESTIPPTELENPRMMSMAPTLTVMVRKVEEKDI